MSRCHFSRLVIALPNKRWVLGMYIIIQFCQKGDNAELTNNQAKIRWHHFVMLITELKADLEGTNDGLMQTCHHFSWISSWRTLNFLHPESRSFVLFQEASKENLLQWPCQKNSFSGVHGVWTSKIQIKTWERAAIQILCAWKGLIWSVLEKPAVLARKDEKSTNQEHNNSSCTNN